MSVTRPITAIERHASKCVVATKRHGKPRAAQGLALLHVGHADDHFEIRVTTFRHAHELEGSVILRDENGVDWECTDMGGGVDTLAVKSGGSRTAFRVLQCTPVNNSCGAPRQIRIPAGVDLTDSMVQQCVLWTASKFG